MSQILSQQTLSQSFTLSGVGIHTGANGTITVHPAEANFGRRFRVGQTEIPARADFVTDTARCTTLGRDGAKVSTVEHLLSALAGLGVDNVLIEVEGPEIPILDGSALPFAEAIIAAGIAGQNVPVRTITLTEDGVSLEQNDSRAQAHSIKDSVSWYEVVSSFDHWAEGETVKDWVATTEDAAETYLKEIAPARTFAFRHEVEMLIAAGLAKGGSLDNALIITPPNEFSTPLRLPAEWGLHKLLDAIGDLALLDARPANLFISMTRTGHRLNVALAQKILQEKA